ncbi:hypothetical protein Tco_0378619 [Tanacetum coccineum]
MAPKRTSTSATPAMTQTAIRKLVADSVSAALEAQAATMANADKIQINTDNEKLLNCTEDYKVKFATSTLTEEALSWWNSFTQPIGIEEAYKIGMISRLTLEDSRNWQSYAHYGAKTEKLVEVFIEGLPRSIEGGMTLHCQVSDLQQGGSSDQELQKQRASHWKQPAASVSNLSCLWMERTLHVTPPNLGCSGMLNIRGRYFIDQ